MTKRTWTEVPLPTGRITIPKWIKAFEVDWMKQYHNAPGLHYLTDGEPEWCLWQEVSHGVFRRVTSCGVLEEFFVHKGRRASLMVPVGADTRHYNLLAVGTVYQQTEQQEGFGGRSFWIKTYEGWVELRGPWHGRHTSGWEPIVTTRWEDVLKQREKWKYKQCFRQDVKWSNGRPTWMRASGCFGHYIGPETLAKLIAHFQPHMRLAEVRTFYQNEGPRISYEPFLPQWGGPKTVILEERWQAKNYSMHFEGMN